MALSGYCVTGRCHPPAQHPCGCFADAGGYEVAVAAFLQSQLLAQYSGADGVVLAKQVATAVGQYATDLFDVETYLTDNLEDAPREVGNQLW